jgi:hypothetical protein
LKNEKKVTDFVIQPTLYINNKEMVVYNKGVKIPKASAVLTLRGDKGPATRSSENSSTVWV